MRAKGKPIQQIDNLNIDDLPNASKNIIAFAQDYKIWLFEGEMGAGKTTLIKALCEALGVVDEVSSPTFALVNEYVNREQATFYHFDFYRIEHEEEAMDIGVDEYFYSGHLCFVEWPGKIPSLIPDEFLRIFITINSDNTRKIVLEIV
ncbi:tRNA (adenosine(37)-N6)-threonylcarbamoyltransferase complex ATPase subunit type 1 TsaE [Fulvivirgaceae bacterium BMA12]|uniref:tRNA threonylcarbamoyladenosine biosynthesis protein TsaE n=1 Tax=Agaribacillus aureus TaxID=3051825 RepID=A0ABT8L6X1_9BACT|nr:tRNA (adenosine(37)-N6)-threonylcarbamoyltransferase complex ATPase subunit type 1 TsaE [Fulvivirgaceae bacterium BMA12]